MQSQDEWCKTKAHRGGAHADSCVLAWGYDPASVRALACPCMCVHNAQGLWTMKPGNARTPSLGGLGGNPASVRALACPCMWRASSAVLLKPLMKIKPTLHGTGERARSSVAPATRAASVLYAAQCPQ